MALTQTLIQQSGDERPLVLHTLPVAKEKANGGEGQGSDSKGGGVATAGKEKGERMHPSMATIPRLVSVVEIIKREYLKTVDPKLPEAGLLSGLHQYNEVGSLEEEGLMDAAEDAEEARVETVARALQGKDQ